MQFSSDSSSRLIFNPLLSQRYTPPHRPFVTALAWNSLHTTNRSYVRIDHRRFSRGVSYSGGISRPLWFYIGSVSSEQELPRRFSPTAPEESPPPSFRFLNYVASIPPERLPSPFSAPSCGVRSQKILPPEIGNLEFSPLSEIAGRTSLFSTPPELQLLIALLVDIM